MHAYSEAVRRSLQKTAGPSLGELLGAVQTSLLPPPAPPRERARGTAQVRASISKMSTAQLVDIKAR